MKQKTKQKLKKDLQFERENEWNHKQIDRKDIDTIFDQYDQQVGGRT